MLRINGHEPDVMMAASRTICDAIDKRPALWVDVQEDKNANWDTASKGL